MLFFFILRRASSACTRAIDWARLRSPQVISISSNLDWIGFCIGLPWTVIRELTAWRASGHWKKACVEKPRQQRRADFLHFIYWRSIVLKWSERASACLHACMHATITQYIHSRQDWLAGSCNSSRSRKRRRSSSNSSRSDAGNSITFARARVAAHLYLFLFFPLWFIFFIWILYRFF